VNPEKPILPLAFALLFSAALGLAAQAQTFKLDGHQLVLPGPSRSRPAPPNSMKPPAVIRWS
jgi:hypothetical protein